MLTCSYTFWAVCSCHVVAKATSSDIHGTKPFTDRENVPKNNSHVYSKIRSLTQMQLGHSDFCTHVFENACKWNSSRPTVISCTTETVTVRFRFGVSRKETKDWVERKQNPWRPSSLNESVEQVILSICSALLVSHVSGVVGLFNVIQIL